MRTFQLILPVIVVLFALTEVAAQAPSTEKSEVDLATPFELSGGKETPEYTDGLHFYMTLEKKFPEIKIKRFGMTDSGFPLHVVMVSGDQDFDIESIRNKNRAILLVNNAIHPGESDGVDASMLFLRDLMTKKEVRGELLSDVFIAIIPYYNIGGALNRNSFSRTNQNGPLEYGFRGNSRNFDLNRDFIKCDTANARSFAEIFHYYDPDLFIDTHVTNGADYQHVMTTTHSQKDKLGGLLGKYLDQTFEPTLFGKMKEHGYPTIPYVNAFGGTPDRGWSQFSETPRYSTGYTALFQTMGFMTETHMLKPYDQRVDSTRVFLQESLELLAKEKDALREIRKTDRENYYLQEKVPVTWKVDRSRHTDLEFMGYEGRQIDSKVTSGKRLFYDRSKPFTKNVKYYNHFIPDIEIKLPAAYVIPQGQRTVLELMRLNRVQLIPVEADMELEAEVYHIADVSHASSPFEGHYMHSKVELTVKTKRVKVKKGDFLVPIAQPSARYVVETLEPQAVDSLFRWNYFDAILQRKEGYSGYVFEDSAKKMLAENEALRKEFEQRMKDDSAFANNSRQQLEFLYQNSPHAEEAYRRYPIFRLTEIPNN